MAWALLPRPLAEGLSSLSDWEPDWVSVGLVLSLVGAFLLGNAVLFRHPRQLVEELFGKRTIRLHAIREHIFHRVQTSVGFTFLLAGFALQLVGRSRPPPVAAEPAFPLFWVGCIVILTATLLIGGWVWSQRAFRRYVSEYFRAHAPDFESDMTMAREVGDLFGVASQADDTIQSYVERLRQAVGLPEIDRRGRRAPMPRPEDVEVEESAL